MECGAHMKADTRETEELLPKLASENWVMIKVDCSRKTMKVSDVSGESLGDSHRHIGVRQQNKVGVLQEAIDDRQYDL